MGGSEGFLRGIDGDGDVAVGGGSELGEEIGLLRRHADAGDVDGPHGEHVV